MKRITKIIALVMALACISLALTSCNLIADKISDGIDFFTKGKIDGDVYTNDPVGIRFTKPSEWNFLSDEEINQLIGATSEVIDVDDFVNGDATSLIDMYATSQLGDSVNVTVSKGVPTQTEDDVMNESVQVIVDQYKSIGWNATASTVSEKKLGGNKYKMCHISVSANVSGVNVSMDQYVYISKLSFGYVSIACTSVSGISEGDFEAMFG